MNAKTNFKNMKFYDKYEVRMKYQRLRKLIHLLKEKNSIKIVFC